MVTWPKDSQIIHWRLRYFDRKIWQQIPHHPTIKGESLIAPLPDSDCLNKKIQWKLCCASFRTWAWQGLLIFCNTSCHAVEKSKEPCEDAYVGVGGWGWGKRLWLATSAELAYTSQHQFSRYVGGPSWKWICQPFWVTSADATWSRDELNPLSSAHIADLLHGNRSPELPLSWCLLLRHYNVSWHKKKNL